MKEYSRRFIYDPHSNILWCQIPKTGSTTYIDAYNKIARMYGRGNFGRLGKQEEVVVKVKEQEPRVTSTSEEKTQEDLRSARASATPGRGINLNCTLFLC